MRVGTSIRCINGRKIRSATPKKKAKSFTVYVGGEQVYDKETADWLHAKLSAVPPLPASKSRRSRVTQDRGSIVWELTLGAVRSLGLSRCPDRPGASGWSTKQVRTWPLSF
ncbi:hypothetical protein OKW43_007527 [Paraburkholderia sp. WC7.3g]